MKFLSYPSLTRLTQIAQLPKPGLTVQPELRKSLNPVSQPRPDLIRLPDPIPDKVFALTHLTWLTRVWVRFQFRNRIHPLLDFFQTFTRYSSIQIRKVLGFLPSTNSPPSRTLWRSPSPKTPLGEFTVLRLPRRARHHQERIVVALGPPRRSRGHGAAARCIVPPPSPTGATMSRPRLDPFVLIKSEPLNQSSMTQVRYWIDKISTVRFIFYGRKNVPLRDLILCVHLRFNNPR
jgi:hypothetical protein